MSRPNLEIVCLARIKVDIGFVEAKSDRETDTKLAGAGSSLNLHIGTTCHRADDLAINLYVRIGP